MIEENIPVKNTKNISKLVRILLTVCLIIVFISVFILIITNILELSKKEESSGDTLGISVFSDKLEPIYIYPVSLEIPAIKLNIKLVKVGVDAKNIMEVPDNWNNGGWFMKSAYAGDLGNVIINGHYDDNYGNPAAFYLLKNLKIDDKVIIVDKYNRAYTYKVNDIFYLDINDPNRFDILKDSEDRELTLITCGGVWVNAGTYNKRLIIKAHKV